MLPDPTDPRGRCEVEAARVVSRLAALGPRRVPGGRMREDCARLAALQWRAEGLPGRPPVIDVEPHGWEHVVRVLTADLTAVDPEPPELAEAADLLTTLRRELP